MNEGREQFYQRVQQNKIPYVILPPEEGNRLVSKMLWFGIWGTKAYVQNISQTN